MYSYMNFLKQFHSDSVSLESGSTDKFCELAQPCHNNATCVDSLFSTYKCICQPGFSGEHCEFDNNGHLVTQASNLIYFRNEIRLLF